MSTTSTPGTGGAPEPRPAADVPARAGTQAGMRARRRQRRWQRAARLLGDWAGVLLLFGLWVGMLLLMTHIIVIPRTCAQKWPAWVPILGNVVSMLGAGVVSRAECFAALGQVPPPVAPRPAETMTTYTLPDDALGLALAMVALSATPLILSFGAALIAKWQQSPRARHCFVPEGEKPEPEWTARERQWKTEAVQRIQKLWVLEARRALQAQHRMIQHACMFGFATSALFAFGLVMNNSANLPIQTRMMTVAAASAALTSFSMSFGRISVRASIRDTSARMFAHALRAVVVSALAAVLLVTLMWHHGAAPQVADCVSKGAKDGTLLSEQPFKSPTSFMMLGMMIALIGEGILSQIVARAATATNLSLAQGGSDGARQLVAVDGLTEQDVLRLSEEGIDSVHALAMASTSSLYFGTPYTLQRICDWQDQALLIAYLGIAKAQACREKLMIRGAVGLQRKAEFLCTGERAQDADAQAEREKIFEIIRSSLGFISVEQARESLFPLAQEETIRRLRIFERGSVAESAAAGAALLG